MNSELQYNNGRINYQTEGNGTPIVFVHGFTLDHNMWRPQVDFFSQTHTVITYDARGFGESSTPNGPYNHTDDLAVLLDHLSIEQAHVVGLSMGGRAAANLALEHPESVLSLTLMDAALDGYQNTVDWDVHAKEQGLENAKINWLNHPIFSSAKANSSVLEELTNIVSDYSGWHWLNDDPQTKPQIPALQKLAELKTPTLVVVGEKDLDYFHDIADVLASEIPDAQKVTIDGAGHMVNMEAPKKINKLVAEFIGAGLDLPQPNIVY